MVPKLSAAILPTSLSLTSNERRRLARLQEFFEPHADPNFATELGLHFQERYWEMSLAYALHRKGKHIRCRGTAHGPDLCVGDDTRVVWIEATSPGRGEGSDAVPPPILVLEGDDPADWERQIEDSTLSEFDAQVPERQILLRYTNALKTKLDKHKAYIRDGIVPEVDPFIIAVNGAAVNPLSVVSHPIPMIVRTVFPFRTAKIIYGNADTTKGELIFEWRDSISKESGSVVQTGLFCTPDYRGISAVLFSVCDVNTCLRKLGTDFVLVHNPQARNQLPLGWLKTGREYWKEGNRLRCRRWTVHASDC